MFAQLKEKKQLEKKASKQEEAKECNQKYGYGPVSPLCNKRSNMLDSATIITNSSSKLKNKRNDVSLIKVQKRKREEENSSPINGRSANQFSSQGNT